MLLEIRDKIEVLLALVRIEYAIKSYDAASKFDSNCAGAYNNKEKALLV